MSFVAPNTDLRVLYDVPLDGTYEHSIYFGSPADQATYFMSKTKYTFSELTYQRVQRGYVRVEKNAEDLYGCNYMMFRNSAFGTKWFYAFITGVEYVSNTVSQISFVLDDIQTWLFDWVFHSCFIERQHTPTDFICEHYEPEPVAVGEYVLNNYEPVGDTWHRELCVIIAVIITDQQTGGPDGLKYQGIYSGTKLYVFYDLPTVPLADQIDNFLSGFVGTPENVVGMYVCPRKYVGENLASQSFIMGSNECFHEQIQFAQALYTDTLDGYLPRNKKLYTYPYNFLHIDNGSNAELSLRYEFFNLHIPKVEINASFLEPVEALLEPVDYKRVSGVYHAESIPLTDFPNCSWNFDSYTEWKNTQAVAKAIRYNGRQMSGIVNSAGSFFGATTSRGQRNALINGASGAVQNAIEYHTNMKAESYLASMQADICKGSSSNGNILTMRGKHCYYAGRCSINAQNAEMIDTYFDKYGYAINKVDTPSINARPKWTYLKTRDCIIIGSVPYENARHICNIFDAGITFWKNGNEVGRYDLAADNQAPIN